MTDLEMTNLCAEAMGVKFCGECRENNPESLVTCHLGGPADAYYDPLHDDAQAMALVKKFDMSIAGGYANGPIVSMGGYSEHYDAQNADLNRAIVECVAKMKCGNK